LYLGSSGQTQIGQQMSFLPLPLEISVSRISFGPGLLLVFGHFNATSGGGLFEQVG
jgi:hypothetical protein